MSSHTDGTYTQGAEGPPEYYAVRQAFLKAAINSGITNLQYDPNQGYVLTLPDTTTSIITVPQELAHSAAPAQPYAWEPKQITTSLNRLAGTNWLVHAVVAADFAALRFAARMVNVTIKPRTALRELAARRTIEQSASLLFEHTNIQANPNNTAYPEYMTSGRANLNKNKTFNLWQPYRSSSLVSKDFDAHVYGLAVDLESGNDVDAFMTNYGPLFGFERQTREGHRVEGHLNHYIHPSTDVVSAQVFYGLTPGVNLKNLPPARLHHPVTGALYTWNSKSPSEHGNADLYAGFREDWTRSLSKTTADVSWPARGPAALASVETPGAAGVPSSTRTATGTSGRDISVELGQNLYDFYTGCWVLDNKEV